MQLTLAPSLEEHSDDKDLQTGHADHHQTLNDGKVEDSLLCASDGGEVSILASSEVFLLTGDCAELTAELEDRVLEGRSLLNVGALLGGNAGGAGLVLDGDFEVDHLVGKGADTVVEAEAVLANLVGCEDEVTLAFLGAIKNSLFSSGL